MVCQELDKSKSLLRLRSGTCTFNAEYCGITEEGVKHIARIRQLKELVLGMPSDHSEEPAAKTEEAYRTIADSMKNLRKLEMCHPYLQKFELGKQWVT